MNCRGMAGTIGALVAVVAAAGCGADDDSDDDGAGLIVAVVSSQPQYVSGGDALVEVLVDAAAHDPNEIEVRAGDTDVSAAFEVDPNQEGRLVGLVEGLDEGTTLLEARAGDYRAEMEVTNHSDQGPVFSGEELPLAACTTEEFGLEPSTPDDGCYAPTQVTWQYVDVDGAVHDLEDPEAPPEDVELLDIEEETVPFVVRTETGVLNRAVYQIAMLEDAWNERLVYRFGGGCGATFTQGSSWAGDPPVDVLRRGYATATATFNTFAVLCNDVVSAETASIVKEHFVTSYGQPVHTIGEGGSGGAIQQLLLAQNNPGLLDGIAPSLPFPDALSISPGVIDCRLLETYYGTDSGAELTAEQRTAINGHASADICSQWDTLFVDGIDPTRGCPLDDIYHPDTNPDGWRCTFWETNVALTGTDPDTGFARSGYDNAGVAYGFDALAEGTISTEEFIDLNEGIGGFDIDGQPQPDRSEVDNEQVALAYASGRVLGPWGGIPETPIILVDIYTDPFDFHDRVRAFTILDRLSESADGDSGDWPSTVSLWSMSPESEGMAAAVTGATGEAAAAPTFALDEWLTAAREHHEGEGGSWQDALAVTKPPSAQSRCILGDDTDDQIVGDDANSDPACVDAMPVHAEPRMAAGGPRTGDVLKCQLAPVEDIMERHGVEFTGEELDRLDGVFPQGMCDYEQPGIGQGPPDDVWQDLG